MGKGEGKGTGGGGFFGFIENAFESALECARCVICCLCCWLISIPVLFIIGIIFIVTPSHRKEHVKTYNNAVDAWVSSGYDQLNGMNGKIRLTLNGVPNSLLQSTSADTIKDTGDDLKKYTKYLKYYYNYNPTWSNPNANFPGGDSKNPTLTTTSPSATLGMPTRAASDVETISVAGNTTNQRQTNCNNDGGIWNYPNCEMHYSLNSVCTIIDISNGSVAVSSEYTGCWANSENSQKQWSDPTVGGGTTAAIYNVASGNPANLNVYVRSAKDPYVVALEVTDGTLEFGLSTAQKLTIGFVLIGISGCLALPFCCVIYAFCRNRDRKGKYIAKFRGQEYVPIDSNQGYNNQGGYNNNQYNQPPPPHHGHHQHAQNQYNQPPPSYNGAPQYNPGYQPQGYSQQGGYQGGQGYPGYP